MTLNLLNEYGRHLAVEDGVRVYVGREFNAPDRLYLGPNLQNGEPDDRALHRECFYVSASAGMVLIELPEKRQFTVTAHNIITDESHLIYATGAGVTRRWATDWAGIALGVYSKRRYWISVAADRMPSTPPAMTGGDDDKITLYKSASDFFRLGSVADRALLVLCLDFLERGDGFTSVNEELAAWLSMSDMEPKPVSAGAFAMRLYAARGIYAYLPADEQGIDEMYPGIEEIVEYLIRHSIVTADDRKLLFGSSQTRPTPSTGRPKAATTTITQAVRPRRGRA